MVPPLRDDDSDAVIGNHNIHENDTSSGSRKDATSSNSGTDGDKTNNKIGAINKEKTSTLYEDADQQPPRVSFSHVHLYVDHVDDVADYKELERKLNLFAEKSSNDEDELSLRRKVWETIDSSSDPGGENDDDIEKEEPAPPFESQNRDVVKQLIAGLGFRVTGHRMPSSVVHTNTRSVLVTSSDPNGVQIIVTSLDDDNNTEQEEFHHFDASNVRRFYNAHNNRQGVAVLAFQVTSVDAIYERYMKKHPNLILKKSTYFCGSSAHDDGDDKDEVKVLEVYAYYQDDTGTASTNTSDTNKASAAVADEGTVLRFVEIVVDNEDNTNQQMIPDKYGACVLPGLIPVDATFDKHCRAAYCDHWVSNVISRTGFLSTLEDTLGFTPKVDFNAGVVAAGEAQIESTVTGNESVFLSDGKNSALKDQSQVYLPINNALSDVGHVHGFLKEIGQGIQHIASRVNNLVEFVQRGNEYRKITGEGFTFLNIPRSYYGILSKKLLMKGIQKSNDDEEGFLLSEDCADEVMRVCLHCKIVSKEFAVDLNTTKTEIDTYLEESLKDAMLEEYRSKKERVLESILHSRYVNLFSLLRHHLSEKTYLGIVRNQILVDVQGEDLLYQIFTCNILQRQAGEEAPFFEFIQRVCSECTDENGCPVNVKPGCGGFGIRNFLTLFLSIEVSKAMMEASKAQLIGDEVTFTYAQKMVDCFTDQLNESNPILTSISDAMTEEGRCREEYLQAAALAERNKNRVTTNDEDAEDTAVADCKSKMEAASLAKTIGNQRLMDCSSKYKNLMRTIREERARCEN